MITAKTLKLSVKSLREFAKKRLPDEELIALDERDECPLDIVRHMCSPDKLGIQLLFIPEEFGGFGGGAFDVYCVCEEMARIDLGVATAVLATFLGSDPITVGATPEQKKIWLSRIANEGLLFAYGATEPDAGSDLGALQTTADRVVEDGQITGYRINGSKQWISNGGIADAYTVLANTPGGPEPGSSWSEAPPASARASRKTSTASALSNTAALSFTDVRVGLDRLVGGVEGQGLLQAQAVFGYTRLMVAAFGLGAGWSALDRAIPYSAKRIQAGAPLSEKQGYTHKLIVPNAVRLEAGRAYIEETAERIDAGEGSLNTEGAIAKYMSTEAGNAAAEASIQALGGYGYTHEYMVEKISRDVRITCIYEGTSEIMEMTISRDRWQLHLKTRGQHYHDRAREMEALEERRPNLGAGTAALALHALAEVMERARIARLTRFQHILLRLGEWIAYAESAAALARRAARMADGKLNEKASRRFDAATLAAISRIFAREAAMRVAREGLKWTVGAGGESAGARFARHSPRPGGAGFGYGFRRRRALRPRRQGSRPGGVEPLGARAGEPDHGCRLASRHYGSGLPRLNTADEMARENFHAGQRLSRGCDRGAGRDSARCAQRARVLEQHQELGGTASRRSRRTAGIRRCTTTPTTTRPTRRIRKSAAGCASTPGTRSSGGWRFRRAWPMPWTARSAGASPAPARRWRITVTRSGPSTPSAPPSFSATPWPASSTISPPCAPTSRNTRANWRGASASPRCPMPCGATSTREWHTRMGDRLPPITEDSMPGELANCLAGTHRQPL